MSLYVYTDALNCGYGSISHILGVLDFYSHVCLYIRRLTVLLFLGRIQEMDVWCGY